MPRRLLLLPALLLLVLAGCAGKNTGTIDQSVADYTLTLPANWNAFPLEAIPAASLDALTQADMRPLGAYTSAPTRKFRLPCLIFARNDTGKSSHSEMLLVRDNIERLFAMGGNLQVTDKRYDEKNRRLIADATLTTQQQISLNVLAAIYFTEKGMLIGFGYSAPGDKRAQAEILQILKSVTLSPELQYQSIVTK